MVDCMLQRICAFPLLAFALALSSCEPADNEPGPGGVTVGEARALDEAAEMIEQQRMPEGTLPNSTGDNVPLPPEGSVVEESADGQ